MPCSFGFRPRRSQHDALQVLVDEAWDGRRWVAESDISNCFGEIPHSGLMSAIEERISDRHVLKLLRAMLRSGVMEDGAVTAGRDRNPAGRGDLTLPVQRLPAPARPAVGRARARGSGPFRGRSAGDVPDTGGGRSGACVAAADPRRAWAPAQGRQDQDRAPERREAREWTSSASTTGGCAPTAPGMFSSSPAGPHAGRCSTPATAFARSRRGERLLLPIEDIVQDLNRYLRGWAGYFRYGNSARQFNLIEHHTHNRLCAVRGQASPAVARLRLAVSHIRLAEPSGLDQPLGNRRRAAAPPGLARVRSNAGGEERR